MRLVSCLPSGLVAIVDARYFQDGETCRMRPRHVHAHHLRALRLAEIDEVEGIRVPEGRAADRMFGDFHLIWLVTC